MKPSVFAPLVIAFSLFSCKIVQSANAEAANDKTSSRAQIDAAAQDNFSRSRNLAPANGENDACYKGDPLICEVELAIWRKTNEFREKEGRAAVNHSPKFAYISRMWSGSQAKSGLIGHAGFPSQRQRDFTAEFGSENLSMNAENVAYTYASSNDPEAIADIFVNDMWAHSPGHRSNMLGSFRSLGAGVAHKGTNWYATQIFGSAN